MIKLSPNSYQNLDKLENVVVSACLYRTSEKKREAARLRYAANRETIKTAPRCRYAAKKQAKLRDEVNEALRSLAAEI